MIKVSNLTCGYQRTVLENISFSAKNNLCILGANGVGKSTLAKALSGLLPSDGEISINSAALSTLSMEERAKSITYIPPKLESFDGLISVYEFVLMGRYPYKEPFGNYTKEDEALVNQRIKESSLEPDQPINALSSGQQQLLLITQALTQQSKIIIFDEPTANLDPKHAKEFYTTLQSLPKSTQKIIITHDLNLARELAFEVLFLKEREAKLYRDPTQFFQSDTLNSCYGVRFNVTEKHVGVAYD